MVAKWWGIVLFKVARAKKHMLMNAIWVISTILLI